MARAMVMVMADGNVTEMVAGWSMATATAMADSNGDDDGGRRRQRRWRRSQQR